MEELRVNSLKVGSQAHEEVIDPSRLLILCSSNTVGAGQAMEGRHLVTLAPKSSDLSEKCLNRTVTLIGGRKGLQQGVLKGLARRLVEIVEVIPDHLGS